MFDKPRSIIFSEIKNNIDSGYFSSASDLLKDLCNTSSIFTDCELLLARTLKSKIFENMPDLLKEVPNYTSEGMGWKRLSEKIRLLEDVKVIILNDNGFNAGAGVGAARQAQCFLSIGWDVALSSTHPKPRLDLAYSKRYGKSAIGHISVLKNQVAQTRNPLPPFDISSLISNENPDLVITGNFHATGIELATVKQLHNFRIPTVIYAHDCDWATGGCAHFLYHDCNYFLKGCESVSCPKKSHSYPPLYKSVNDAWRERSEIIGSTGIPIAVNSTWTKKVFSKRFPNKKDIFLVHLGVDTNAFFPKDKNAAKKQFGLDPQRFVVLTGFSSFATRGKGREILEWLFEYFKHDESILFVFFGHTGGESLPKNVIPLGYISGEDQLCNAYNAADIFLNPVSIESFGQTMLEAASCGLPIIGLKKTGVEDIIHHGINGFFCSEKDLSSFASAINVAKSNPILRTSLASNSRKIVENLFSHASQSRSWCKTLLDISFNTANRYNSSKKTLKSVINSTPSKRVDVYRCNLSRKILSIVTVTYNIGKEFIRTAESILEQTEPIEWIIIDGKSNQYESLDILKRYSKKADKFISEPDSGIYNAFNKSLRFCSGKYVLFLGSGDFLSYGKITNMITKNMEDKDILVGNVVEVKKTGECIKTKSINPIERLEMWKNKNDFSPPLRGMPPHQATIIRLKLCKKYRFDERFSVCADWDQIFRICHNEKPLRVGHVDDVIAWYPNGGFSSGISDQWLQETSIIVSKYCNSPSKYQEFYSKSLANQYKIIAERLQLAALVEPIEKKFSL